jgi:hypothetical protein
MVPPTDGRSDQQSPLDTAGTFAPMSGVRTHIVGMVVAVSVLVSGAGCLPAPRAATGSSRPTSLASASAATSPRPSPSPKAHTLAIGAFVERVTSGRLTYRVVFKGTARASADILPIAGTMDVAGADFATSFTYDFSAEYADLGKERVQVRAVKGKSYIKRGAKAWQPVKGYSIADSYVPFKSVATADDVRYLGEVTAGNATMHKVGIAGALLVHPNTIPFDVQKEKVDDTELILVIDDTGRPRSGTWKLWGQARVGIDEGQLQRVVYDLDLTFSKVGAKIRIARP